MLGRVLWQAGDHEAALLDAYQATQADLSCHPGLDCDMSGCTATTAMLVEDTIVVANAGDSRCIIGTNESGRAGGPVQGKGPATDRPACHRRTVRAHACMTRLPDGRW